LTLQIAMSLMYTYTCTYNMRDPTITAGKKLAGKPSPPHTHTHTHLIEALQPATKV